MSPETERVIELVFYWPDHRATSQFAETARGFDVLLDRGDEVQNLGEQGYVIHFAERPAVLTGKTVVPVVPARTVRIPTGYTWMEQRTYSRAKKIVTPTGVIES